MVAYGLNSRLGLSSYTEPLTSGEAIFARLLSNADTALTSEDMVLSYWTAATSGEAAEVTTATVDAAASGLTYAALGVFGVDAEGDLTLLGSTGNLSSTLWAAEFTAYTSPLAFTRVAGQKYALGALAVGSGMPQLCAPQMYFAFDTMAPMNFGVVAGLATLPASVPAASVGDFQSSGVMAVVAP